MNDILYKLKRLCVKFALPLWKRKELIRYFLTTEIKLAYGDRLLGFFWAVLDPLMMMVVYTFLVVIVFDRGGPQFPILLFSALLSWRWFTFSIIGSVKSLTGKARIIQTVSFPKATLPLTRVLLGLTNYLWGLVALTPLLFLFHAQISVNILWLPFLILVQFMLTLGLALILAIVGVYFRDISNILQFTLRLWFYLSPGLYSIDSLSAFQKYITIYLIVNPFATLFESYKNILVRGEPPNPYIWVTLAIAIGSLALGACHFARKETTIVKEL